MTSSLSGQSFYYSFNDSVPLTEVSNQYVVKFTDTASAVFMSNQITSVPNSQIESINATYAVVSGNTTISSLRQLGGVEAVHKKYKIASEDVFFNNKITLKFKSNATPLIRQNIETTYNLTFIDSSVVHKTFKVHQDSSSIKIANAIHELGYTEYCYPRFQAKAEPQSFIPNDEYFNYQFYLQSSINTLYNDGKTGTAGADISITDAWDITFGNKQVVTAVIDDGVPEFHNDIPLARQLRLPGSNMALAKGGPTQIQLTGTDPNNPNPYINHGTAVAGIIAGEIDNGIGIAGIAPKTTIMPIRIAYFSSGGLVEGDPSETVRDAILFAEQNGAHIINISMSFNSGVPDITDAINYVIQNGRGGKGCVVVICTGNTANHQNSNIGYVAFPANHSSSAVIAVGASNRNNLRANYSPEGLEVDVVAPSHHAYCSQISSETFEVWTTDEEGFGGIAKGRHYNPWSQTSSTDCPGYHPVQNEVWPNFGTDPKSYTGRFGGTSAAAPQVAGLAALILSMNPCLTAQEVKDYITENADQIGIGSYNYNWSTTKPNHSKEVGYGKINAYQTLLAVRGDLGQVQTAPISGNISISTPTDYASDIEIASGGVLTINSTLRMARDRKIVVRPGGKLVLAAGSKITSISECGNITWQGIQVGGNSNLAQKDANQGVVDINGTAQNPAIIENAIDAISTGVNIGNGPCPPIDWNSFGGIVKADYCHFENNLRDVQFMAYKHYEGGIWQPNASYFNHCTFVKDRTFADPDLHRGAAVSMWAVQGVTFTACTFDNSALALEDQNVTNGIYGLNANFTVQWDCQNPNTQTGCTNADSSYFKGMEYGIRAEYTLGFSGQFTRVHGTEFKSTNGLYIGGSYGNIATRNSFYVEKLPAFVYPDIPYGLYFDYATNFTAQENAFYTRGTTGHNAGMVVNNHGSLDQLVYNNTFDDYLLGLSAQGENRSSEGETGLECRCNNFTQGEYDMFVYGDPNQTWNGIKRNQGSQSPLVLASNLFSLSGGLYSDYFNLPDYIIYHHHDPNYGTNPPNVEPEDIFNVNPIMHSNEQYTKLSSCPVSLEDVPPGKTSGEWQTEIAAAELAMHTDEVLLEQLLNEDEVWQLEAEILFAGLYDNWYDVYLDMMNQSPYLDHGIIEGLIQDLDFPDLMLRNIMLANPDAAKAQHLLDLIYIRNMPAWMLADIEAGKSSYGAKEVLVGRIGYNKGVQHNAISGLLGMYGSSTSYNGLDSTIALLSNRDEVPYAYLRADAYLAKGQHAQALTLVNNLPQTHILSEKEALDYPAYQSWYALRAQMAEGNHTWFDADAAQKTTLQTLADTANHNATMLWANHALKLIGEETAYREPVYLPNPVAQKKATQQVANILKQEMVKAYPNPASDILNVVANGVVKGQVALYSLDGKLLIQTELSYGTAILNVKGLTPGVYLVRVYAENHEEIQTVKVVVSGK